MESERFTIQEAIKFGWKAARENIWFFVKLFLVLLGVQIIISVLTGTSEPVGSIFSTAFSVVTGTGFIVIALKAADNQQLRISDFWAKPIVWWHYFLTSLLLILLIAPLMLLVIFIIETLDSRGPGGQILPILLAVIFTLPIMYLLVAFQFATYRAVDALIKPIRTFTYSWQITRGARLKLILLMVVLFLINILGAMVVIIGMLWTVPLSIVAMGYVYRRLEEGGAEGGLVVVNDEPAPELKPTTSPAPSPTGATSFNN